MQYQTCECGEQIPPNELPTKILTHWSHQQSCLYSHIGCVSKTSFDSIYVEHATIRVLTDRYFPAYEQNQRFCTYIGKYGSAKTRILAYYTQWKLYLKVYV